MSDAPNPKVSELLREGIRAARAGEKEQARELLQQVVDLDQYSEQGWFWLASVVETDEERRTCLGNVVVINPNNTKAQELLERLEGMASGEYTAAKEIIPGVDRRMSMIMIAVGAALLLVVCGVIILMIAGGGDDNGTNGEAQVDGSGDSGEGNDDGSNQSTPTVTFTPRPTAVRPTLPPAATETPRPSPTTPPPTLLPPSEGISGRLVIGSGNHSGKVEPKNPYNDQPLFSIAADDILTMTALHVDDSIRGNSPSFSPDGSRFIYAQFLRSGPVIQIHGSDGVKLADLGDYWNRNPVVFQQRMPAWSPVNNQIVFVGRVSGGIGSNSDNLFLIDAPVTVPSFETSSDEDNPDEDVTPAESPLRILTDDTVNKLWPTWSPNGQQIVFVAEFPNRTDLVVMNMSDGSIRELTNDGNERIESAPDWGGTDGNSVIYSATSADGLGTDIWIVSLDDLGDVVDTAADETETDETEGETVEDTLPEGESVDGSGEGDSGEQEAQSGPTLLFDFGPNDIEPHWSPDGRYIVFSSDRNGRRFDVFIFDTQSGDTFKVTDDPERTDVALEWLP